MTQQFPAHVVRRLDDLQRQLAATAHGSKTGLVQACADELGCSMQTVHRWLKQHAPCPVAVARQGPRKSRKRRADAGMTGVTEHELKLIAAAMAANYRENGKRMLSIADTVAMMRANGKITTELSPGHIAKLLHRRGLHSAQQRRPSPSVHQRSLHPNHVWQVDASVCTAYYLSNATGLQQMDRKAYYKNKPENFTRIQSERLVRYALADHFSHEILVRYYLGSECSRHLAHFLMWCMAEQKGRLMHGVPFILQMDLGSANTSAPVLNMLGRLGVKVMKHQPHNSRANGSVEKAHDIIENGFEGGLAFTHVKDLEDLNAKALRWCHVYCAQRKHSRHKKTRHQMWQTILPHQLRVAPPIAVMKEMAVSKPQTRVVSADLKISFATRKGGSLDYCLQYLPGVMAGQKVEVVVNVMKAPAIDVKYADSATGGDCWLTVQPVVKDEGGFAADAPVIGVDVRQGARTVVEKGRDEIVKLLYAAKTVEEAATKKAVGVRPFGGTVDAFKGAAEANLAAFLPKKGKAIQYEQRTVEPAKISCVEAATRIRDALKRNGRLELFGAHVLQMLNAKFAKDGVPEDIADGLAKYLLDCSLGADPGEVFKKAVNL